MSTIPLEALRRFEPDVAAGRVLYSTALGHLPPKLATIASAHFHERVRRAGPSPLLGEYAPWLVAEIIGNSHDPRVREFVTAWLHVYFFTMLLDDVIDQPNRTNRSGELLTAMVLLQEGICELMSNLCLDPNNRAQQLQKSFRSTALAALEELQGYADQEKPTDLSRVGKKVSFLRICVDALSDIAESSTEQREWLHGVIERFGTGIQLLDDLTDWQEDLAVSHHTLPVSIALKASPNMASSHADRVALLEVLLQSRALEVTTMAATVEFESATRSLEEAGLPRNNRSYLYIESLLRRGQDVVNSLLSARKRLNRTDRTGSDFLRERQVILDEVEQTLKIVAQGS